MPGVSTSAEHSPRARPKYLNALLNVCWSLVCIAPIFIFCYQYMARPLIYGLAAISLVAYGMPAAALRQIQLSSRTNLYRLLRVHLLVHFTQDGGAIKTVSDAHWSRNREVLTKMVRVTYGRERFHLAMFLFFLSAAVYAACGRHLAWSLLLCLSNVIYNLYPIWLQQYIRLRLQRCLLRSEYLQGTLAVPDHRSS